MESIEVTDALTSWTRTLNEDDALTLLDNAYAGTPIEDWTELADRLLSQAGAPRRRELIRTVRDELLDVRDGSIVTSGWLRIFQPHNHNPGPAGFRRCYPAASDQNAPDNNSPPPTPHLRV